MAATPPPLSPAVRTPSTPLHGAAYDEPHRLRRFTRSANRRPSRDSHSTPEQASASHRRSDRSGGTPVSRRRVSHPSTSATLSPPSSPQHTYKSKVSQRAKTTTPRSPAKNTRDEFAPSAPISIDSSHSGGAALNPTTTMAPGMLPTPAKTPRKKPVTNVSAAARVLFPSQRDVSDDVLPTPKRSRKAKRYNGFSLESFSAENDESGNAIQIFTDSRDKLPELDETEDNPFITRAENGASSGKKVAGTSKRRKLSGESAKKDLEVEKNVGRADGMVYVFRGKKIFRKFDDEEADEEVASDDEGLLKYTDSKSTEFSSGPTRPVTRSTFKPKLLFPTEEQRRARDFKVSQEDEEEVTTDIEEEAAPATPVKIAKSTKPVSPPSTGRSKRVAAKKDILDEAEAAADLPQDSVKEGKKKAKTSPFETWKRTKASSSTATPSKAASAAVAPSKTRKRTAETADDDDAQSMSKKSKIQ